MVNFSGLSNKVRKIIVGTNNNQRHVLRRAYNSTLNHAQGLKTRMGALQVPNFKGHAKTLKERASNRAEAIKEAASHLDYSRNNLNGYYRTGTSNGKVIHVTKKGNKTKCLYKKYRFGVPSFEKCPDGAKVSGGRRTRRHRRTRRR